MKTRSLLAYRLIVTLSALAQIVLWPALDTTEGKDGNLGTASGDAIECGRVPMAYGASNIPSPLGLAGISQGDVASPTLTITTPTEGQTITTSTIVVSGTVTDAGSGDSGISSVTVNGMRANNDTVTGAGTANWSLTFTLTPGSNTLTIVAKDASPSQNPASKSVTVNFKQAVDPDGPTLAIISPSNGQTVTSGTLVVSGTATDSGSGDNGISSVKVNGVRANNDTTAGTGTANWSLAIALTPGPNTITVEAKDNSPSQNPATKSVAVDFKQAGDLAAPTLTVLSPNSGQLVTSSTIIVSGTATDAGSGDSGISSVTVNGVRANNDTTGGAGTANWSLAIGLTEGSNTVTIVAKDNSASKNPSTKLLSVFYQPPPPAPDIAGPMLNITSPNNGQVVTASAITITGTASDSGSGDNGVSSVTVNGVRASGDTTSGGSTANWSLAITLVPGANSITVEAKDNSPSKNSSIKLISVNFNSNSTPTATLAFVGKQRDRVGRSKTALGPDGDLDGVFNVNFSSDTGVRTITSVSLVRTGSGAWDTDPTNGLWVAGVADSLDAPLRNSANGSVNIGINSGSSLSLFVADNVDLFRSGALFTLTVRFSDGVTVTAQSTVTVLVPSAPQMTYLGKQRDRVGRSKTALGPDGDLDGVFTVNFSSDTGVRTITSVSLVRSGSGAWDTDPTNGLWVAGVADSLDAPLRNSANGSVNIGINSGTSLSLFVADNVDLFGSGTLFTVTVRFSDGITVTAQRTITVLVPSAPQMAYLGKLRDKVGRSKTALGPDGDLDGVFTVNFSADTGARMITRLSLVRTGSGAWDTDPTNGLWIVGVADSFDAPLRNSVNGSVNIGINSGTSLSLFVADNVNLFNSGASFGLMVRFSDGVSLVASATVPALPPPTLAFNGKLRDRVGRSKIALAPDGDADGTFTLSFPLGVPSRTITNLSLLRTGNGGWDTDPTNGLWVAGAADSLDGALRNNANGSVSISVVGGNNLVLFVADNASLFGSGVQFTLTIRFADGSDVLTTTVISVVAPPSPGLTFNGKPRDRVGRGKTALGADGSQDGTFTLNFQPGTGERTINALLLVRAGGGAWDTIPSSGLWVVGACDSLDAPLLNNLNGGINLPVNDGRSLILFVSDNVGFFGAGDRFTLTVGFADGTTTMATASVASPSVVASTSNFNLPDLSLGQVQNMDSMALRRQLSPDSVALAFTRNQAAESQPASEWPLPLVLGGTTVTVVDSRRIAHSSPLFAVSPEEVTYLVPAAVAHGRAMVLVRNGDRLLMAEQVDIVPSAPALFTTAPAWSRLPLAAISHLRSDGTTWDDWILQTGLEGRGGTTSDRAEFADEDEELILSLYGTGIRQRSSLAEVEVIIGGTAAQVLYAGPQWGYAGIDEVRVRVPHEVRGSGLCTVELRIGLQRAREIQVFIR